MENLPEKKSNPMIRVAPGGGLIPENFDGLWRLANIFSASGLMPKGIDRPESVFVAVQMGLEIGLSPMQAVQNIAVINGRPSIWGDAALSLVRASGKMETFIEEIVGEWPNDDCKAICTVKRIGDAKETVRTFSCADAKLAGLHEKTGPWKQYPKRMLQMRARSWALRDAFTDVLKGVRVAEEQMDAKDMLTLQQDDLGSYSIDGPSTVDLSNKDTSLYVEKKDDKQQVDAPKENHRPTGNLAHNGPPEGVKMNGEPIINEPEWDPRKNELLGKYYPEKREAVLRVANEMGISTEGRTPKDVHADILAATNKQGEQPPDMAAEKSALIDKALALMATNDQRWNAIVKTLSRAGELQSAFIQEWNIDQLTQVIGEFELIDNPDQQEQF